MRVSRVAALVSCVAIAAPGRAQVVRGDSVRISIPRQNQTLGRVTAVDRDSLVLDDGRSLRFADVQRVEVGRPYVDRERQIAFAIVGGAIGFAAGSAIKYSGCDCTMSDRGLAGGAVAGVLLGGRKRSTRWVTVSSEPVDIVPTRAMAPDPPITPAAFVPYRNEPLLRVWVDTMRVVGVFARADNEFLYLRPPGSPIALHTIDVVERRVTHTVAYGVVGAVGVGVLGLVLAGIDCGLGGNCTNSLPVGVISAGSGFALGAIIGTVSGDWRVDFSRRR